VKEIVSTITDKGQVTIPAEVRRLLGVEGGDKLAFVIADSGAVQIRRPPYPNVASLRERSPGLEGDPSHDEMKEIAHVDRLARKHNPQR
jgi:AbrB family looped-hinge helix DNA binding protein